MPAIIIKDSGMAQILSSLLSREVQAVQCQGFQPHPATYRGLVSDENHLLSVIASDLEFAHRSAAALAMIPAGAVENKLTVPDQDLMDFYGEVANVLSRLINEAAPTRLRLDPGMEHSAESLESIVTGGACIISCETTIEGYGSGSVGIWVRTV